MGYSPWGLKESDTTEQVLDDGKTKPSVSLFFNISFIYLLIWLPLSHCTTWTSLVAVHGLSGCDTWFTCCTICGILVP